MLVLLAALDVGVLAALDIGVLVCAWLDIVGVADVKVDIDIDVSGLGASELLSDVVVLDVGLWAEGDDGPESVRPSSFENALILVDEAAEAAEADEADDAAAAAASAATDLT
ncbi:hypothetical protein GGH95_004864 [Coemansia sp. RSA 1836]|nr:hypothetical protein GGH95_004864 [Coemansia sp. RSA 1836]